FRELPDLSGMTSDAMDLLGIAGAVSASLLRPTDPRARLVGRALTIHNIASEEPVAESVAKGVSLLGDMEAHNLAESGDVLVLQGVNLTSNMGAIMATIAKRQGEIGAIIDGAVRDVDHSREIGFPVWSASVSPITGKWRVRTISINKPVTIQGVSVAPGDLVVADEVGICFVPAARALEVLEWAHGIAKNEEVRLRAIHGGTPLTELIKPRTASRASANEKN
ncbi:MAG: RraA family protein, partial [Bryobacteraceae bacterium]